MATIIKELADLVTQKLRSRRDRMIHLTAYITESEELFKLVVPYGAQEDLYKAGKWMARMDSGFSRVMYFHRSSGAVAMCNFNIRFTPSEDQNYFLLPEDVATLNEGDFLDTTLCRLYEHVEQWDGLLQAWDYVSGAFTDMETLMFFCPWLNQIADLISEGDLDDLKGIQRQRALRALERMKDPRRSINSPATSMEFIKLCRRGSTLLTQLSLVPQTRRSGPALGSITIDPFNVTDRLAKHTIEQLMKQIREEAEPKWEP